MRPAGSAWTPARYVRGPQPGARTHDDTPPGPMEILARLAGGTTFRTPRGPGTGTGPRRAVTMIDIAHALGSAHGLDGEPTAPLGKAMALAIACQRASEWPRVHRLAHASVLTILQGAPRTRAAFVPPYAFRARVVLHDAFMDLVTGRAPDPRPRARALRMRPHEYERAHKTIAAWLEAHAQTAAGDAVRGLFGR